MKISDLNFTLKETQIVTYLAKGLPRKVIADSVNISVSTLDDHLKNIRRKCGTSTNFEAGCFLAKFF